MVEILFPDNGNATCSASSLFTLNRLFLQFSLRNAAFNAALRVAEATSEQKMAKITAGLPPGMKLPF
jgi:hypothetical protein